MNSKRVRNTGENRIREVMKEQGRKTSWVCDAIGVKPSAFGHWLNNHAQPSLFKLKEISKLLEVSMEDLLV